MNHNRSTVLERSVIEYWEEWCVCVGGGGGSRQSGFTGSNH